MPLTKRILLASSSLESVDNLIDVDSQATVQEFSSTNVFGTLRQLACLSSYALEIFTNLAVLVEDCNDRAKYISKRTETAISKLSEFDRGVRNATVQPDLKLNRLSKKYLKFRELSTPPIFVKTTNYSSILLQYKLCRNSPQLWRVENVIGEDCFRYFSFPGFFFEEWLKTEIIHQELRREQRRKEKALKKQQKKERKKLREEMGISFKRISATERPRSLLSREAKSLDVSKDLKPTDVDISERFSHTPTESSIQLNQPNKKSGLSSLFGFLTKEKSSTTEMKASTARISNMEETVADFGIPAAEPKPATTGKSIDHLSMQILNSKLKNLDSVETQIINERSSRENLRDDERTSFQKISNLKSIGLFEEVPSDTEKLDSHIAGHVVDSTPNSFASDPVNDDQDPFNFRLSMRRKPVNYSATTKLGKYLSGRSGNDQDTAVVSGSKAPLLLSKRIVSDNKPNSQSVHISLLPSQPVPTKAVAFRDEAPLIEPLTESKQRKRASVIYSPNLINSLAQQLQLSSDSVDESENLVNSLRADLFSTEPVLDSILEENEYADNEDEVRDNSYGSRKNMRFDDAVESDFEEEIVSSKPFSNPATEGTFDSDASPDNNDSLNEDLPSLPSDDEEFLSSVNPHPPPPPPIAKGPPPPPPPKQLLLKSAVGDDVLSSIRNGGANLRRVEPNKERVVDMRSKLLNSIKSGSSNLRTVQVGAKKINNAMQNAAVAAILANRSKIAGSDSEDSDSDDDSVFTDEDYG